MVHDDMECSHYMKNFEVGHVPLRYEYSFNKPNLYSWLTLVTKSEAELEA